MAKAKKVRTPIPDDVAAEVMFSSASTCCKCNQRGLPIEIHHIDENPSNHAIENLAVLCKICHHETQVSGGFSRKLDAPTVSRYRDDWLRRVSERRSRADEIAIKEMVGQSNPVNNGNVIAPNSDLPTQPSANTLYDYLYTLPERKAEVYKRSQPEWDSGVTSRMVNGSYEVINLMEQIWVHLAQFFPENHFDNTPPQNYIDAYLKQRFVWHRALAEPEGVGTGGTIVSTMVAGSVMFDIDNIVIETVRALTFSWGDQDFPFKLWKAKWEAAQSGFSQWPVLGQ